MRRHQGNQRIHRRIIDGVRLNDAFFPLTGNLQRRFALPGIACQQNRLQVFIGFQQLVVEITVVAQALQIAAGNNDRVHGKRWRPGKGPGHRQLGTVIGLHFPHSGIE